MTRRSFTQADVRRAVVALLDAGLTIARVEIEPGGKITIVPGTPQPLHVVNEWADLE